MMKQLFLSILLSVQLFSSSYAFCATEYKSVKRLLKKKNLETLEKTAQDTQNKELTRAIHATRRLATKYNDPPISKREFLQAAYYIETQLPYIKHSANHYLTKKKTGLKHDIEYDPTTGHTFIVLNSKKAFIGSGAKKSVYKTIHYSHHDPKVLARSEQTLPMPDEIKALKALQGVHGVMNAHAFTHHKSGNKKYYTIYSDCFKGTVSDLFSKKEIDFRNKLIIMHDLIRGLDSMHSRNYVHRDLHAYNYLLFEENLSNGNKILRAVIADLGRTIKIDQAKNVRAQMTSRLCPPEGFNQKKLKGKDYFATDVYALGCILYRLHHNRFPKWQGEFLRSDKLSPSKKKALLIKKLNKATASRRKQLQQSKERNEHLSLEQQAELLILHMINPDPSKRGTAAQLRHDMHAILHKAG